MVLQNLIFTSNNINDNSFNLQDILGRLFGNNAQRGGFDTSNLLNLVRGDQANAQQGGGDMIGGLLNRLLANK